MSSWLRSPTLVDICVEMVAIAYACRESWCDDCVTKIYPCDARTVVHSYFAQCLLVSSLDTQNKIDDVTASVNSITQNTTAKADFGRLSWHTLQRNLMQSVGFPFFHYVFRHILYEYVYFACRAFISTDHCLRCLSSLHQQSSWPTLSV